MRKKSHNLRSLIKHAGSAELLLRGAVVLLLALVACQPQADDAPTIELQSPQAGLEIAQGERVLVQSLAQDDHGSVSESK